MAAANSSSDKAAELLQTLSLDSQSETLEVHDPAKKSVPVSSTGLANGTAKPFNPSAGYVSNGFPSTTYYYGGYDGQSNQLNDYSRYLNTDSGMNQGIYGDNGSYMYHQGYGFTPYGTYMSPSSPTPTMQHEGQLYGMQHYQYPSPYYHPMAPSSGSSAPNKVNTSQGYLSTSVAAGQVQPSVGLNKGRPVSVVNGSSINDSSILPGSQSKHGASRGFSSHVTNAKNFSPWRSQNQNINPPQHFRNLHNSRPESGLVEYMERMYPINGMYGQYGSTHRAGSGLGSVGYVSRANRQGFSHEKIGNVMTGNGGYGKSNVDGFNELNKGPRAKSFVNKSSKGLGPVTSVLKGQNFPVSEELPLVSNKERYNGEDFPENYADAKFFVIKSYSEDDVHKSIKYSVWASTPNGNKKLDAAYKEKQSGCPVFLLFSVNTSGQFVGLAEMVGPVNFDKTVDYWQQDRWNGCFPVKWHIIKDVSNSLLRHITLENNENKPVTNSRDTQEVMFQQGIQILKIFREHSSKACILDDFAFYEARQRTMQEKRAKEQLILKQVSSYEKEPMLKSLDAASLAKETVIVEVATGDAESKLVKENITSHSVEDASRSVAKPAISPDRSVASNGVASAC